MLGDGGRFELFIQFGDDCLSDRLRIHRLGKKLHGKQIVIAIHNQTGEKVSLAEHHTISVGIAHHFFPIRGSGPNALAQQTLQILHRLRRNHADGNLRGAAVERGPQRFAALIRDLDQRSGSNALRRNNVGTIDPDVAVFQAIRAAAGNLDQWRRRRERLTRHLPILNLQRIRHLGPAALVVVQFEY
jgi:hypothetical protein